MNYKWIGAILIIAGCGGVGFSIALGQKKEEKLLRQLQRVLQFMECELQYKLTPLPDLCCLAGKEVNGVLKYIFNDLGKEIDRQVMPDVRSCLCAALDKNSDVPASLRRLLKLLGSSLGRYDLPGQLRGIQSVSAGCEVELKKLGKDRDFRLRSYQTLALCAGAAIVILFA